MSTESVQPEPVDYSEADAMATNGTGLTRAPLVLGGAEGAGERIDRYVAGRLPEHSRTRIQRWLALGAVLVDGRSVSPKHRLSGHETIEVWPLPADAEQAFEPDPIDLQVVHEDADLLIIDKPAGLVTHPAPGNWRGTLMNGLLHARADSARLPRAGIVHRLDKDTSGLMAIARSERAFDRLTADLAARRIGRRYLAVVEGPIVAEGRIDAPIGRDPRGRVRMAVVAADRGKSARTSYRPLGMGNRAMADAAGGLAAAAATAAGAAAGPGARAQVTLIECELDTGRTHQIRVHLASCGHPLVGDVLYGGRPLGNFNRQALHAWRLTLSHPGSGAALDFHRPPPADLLAVLAICGLQGALPARASS